MPLSQPTIQFTFRGILALLINEAAGRCDVGFLRQPPPGHILTIDVTQSTATGTSQVVTRITDENIEPKLWLDVENVSLQGVHLFTQRGFNREQLRGDKHDFRWAVDFKDLYGGATHLNPSEFKAMMSINNGKFFTETISEDELRLQRGGGEPQTIGRVATAIGAHIFLDRLDSKAVFKNGNKTLFEYRPEPGVTYQINVSQSPPPEVAEVPQEADSNFYHAAIRPPEGQEQIQFLLPEEPLEATFNTPVSQHAVCFTGTVRG